MKKTYKISIVPLLIVSSLFLSFGCAKGKKGKSGSAPVDNTSDQRPILDEVPTESVPAKDYEVSASRDYNPSSWSPGDTSLEGDQGLFIPSELDVIVGNSGTGWATLEVGARKLCYQGNAGNSNNPNGTKFILKYEKTNTSSNCDQNNDKGAFSTVAFVKKDELIKLSINGGGCGQHCKFTEIKAILLKREDYQALYNNVNSLVQNDIDLSESQKLKFEGVTLVDFSKSKELITPYGSFKRGRVENIITLDGKEFLVLGEDGVFSAECEANSTDSTHGPGHPDCQTFGAESYNSIILCHASDFTLSVKEASKWISIEDAFQSTKGLTCWVDGVKQTSSKYFIY